MVLLENLYTADSFIETMRSLTAAVKHNESFPLTLDEIANKRSLENIRQIANWVSKEIDRAFPNQSMPSDALAEVLRLESVLKAARGAVNLRLAALKGFDPAVVL